ncbi:B-cell receptor CD22-like [Chanos chanos]|uniref:B-cell receptor CD22-like n=1 Tax=Chanos chanos TaxID=29144 RepID=A0A6J2W3D8_CHACN|nr:B-cell receptor CD22-like [Chanos chanos]
MYHAFLDSPKNTRVSVSPSGEIVEGSSVTLTCSSDANPLVHTHTWYKIRDDKTSQVGNEKNLNLNLTHETSGHYYCEAQNLIGVQNSTVFSVELPDSPKNTTVSVSPSGEIVEGSSVTLTCSSDANPLVHTYTWYKKNGAEPSLMGSGQNYSITNISSEDSGQYFCRAENQVEVQLRLKLVDPPEIVAPPSGNER